MRRHLRARRAHDRAARGGYRSVAQHARRPSRPRQHRAPCRARPRDDSARRLRGRSRSGRGAPRWAGDSPGLPRRDHAGSRFPHRSVALWRRSAARAQEAAQGAGPPHAHQAMRPQPEHPPGPSAHRCVGGGERSEWLGQVHPDHGHACARNSGSSRAGRDSRPSTARSSSGSPSTGSSSSTSRPSAAPRGARPPPTPRSGTQCASSLRARVARWSAAGGPAGSRSTASRAAARCAKGGVRSWSRCTSCPTCGSPATTAGAGGSAARRSRCAGRARASQTCSPCAPTKRSRSSRTSARSLASSRRWWMWALATSPWGSPGTRSRAERPNASSSRRSSRAARAMRCTCSTSPPRGCTWPTWRGSWRCSIGWSTMGTR